MQLHSKINILFWFKNATHLQASLQYYRSCSIFQLSNHENIPTMFWLKGPKPIDKSPILFAIKQRATLNTPQHMREQTRIVFSIFFKPHNSVQCQNSGQRPDQ